MIKKYRLQLKKELTKNIGQAIQNIEKTVQVNSPIYNELIFLQSRFYDSKTEQAKGTIREADYRVLLNQDRQFLIDLIDKITEHDLNLDEAAAYFEHNDLEFIRPEKQEPTARLMAFGASPTIPQKGQADSQNIADFKWREESPFYLDSFDANTATTPIFRTYEEELWSGKMTNGCYQLENRADELAVRYHFLNLNGLDMSLLPTTIEVKINADDHYPEPSCGLICCFHPTTKYYYAFIVSNNGEYKLWLKGEGGYTTLIAGRSNLIRPNSFNKMGFIRSQQHIYLFINDSYLRRVEDRTLASGDSGIIAVGKGQFQFDNLTFYKAHNGV